MSNASLDWVKPDITKKAAKEPEDIPSDLLTGINCEDDEEGGGRGNGKVAPRITMSDEHVEDFLEEIGISGEDVEMTNVET